MKRSLLAAGALSLLLFALTACGVPAADAPAGERGEKDHYYQILDAAGGGSCTPSPTTMPCQRSTPSSARRAARTPHTEARRETPSTPMPTGRRPPSTPGRIRRAEREYLEVLPHPCVRGTSDAVTTEVLSDVLEEVGGVYPGPDLGGLLTFTAEVSREPAGRPAGPGAVRRRMRPIRSKRRTRNGWRPVFFAVSPSAENTFRPALHTARTAPFCRRYTAAPAASWGVRGWAGAARHPRARWRGGGSRRRSPAPPRRTPPRRRWPDTSPPAPSRKAGRAGSVHSTDLGGPDGGGSHVEHAQVVAAGDVAAQGHLQPLVQHGPDRGGAGADVDVGVRTVDCGDAGLLHGRPLPPVGPDAVGHHRAPVPEAGTWRRSPSTGSSPGGAGGPTRSPVVLR